MKRSLFSSFACAFRGIYFTVKTERNVKIHLAVSIIAITLGFYLGLSVIEWCLVVFSIGLVLTAELLNTALEHWCDEAAGGRYSEIIRNAKDMSAAAVLLAAIAALITGILILVIPFFQRIIQ